VRRTPPRPSLFRTPTAVANRRARRRASERRGTKPPRRIPIACSVTVAAAVMWWGAPERELWPPLPVEMDEPTPEPAPPEPPQTIQIASIEARPPAPLPRPLAPPEAEPLAVEQQAAEPLPEPEEPVSAPPMVEAATRQLESELPEGLPIEPELPEPEVQAQTDPQETVQAQLDVPEPELAQLEPDPVPEPLPETAAAEAPASRESQEPIRAAQTPEPPQPQPRRQVAELQAVDPNPPTRPRETPAEPVDDVSIAIGRHRIENGRYPHQRASYARIGFEPYRDAMLALGGGFFLFDARNKRVVAELDPYSLKARATQAAPKHLSRWPRDVTRYLGAALTREHLDPRFRGSSLRVVLLPPADLDAAFVGGLDRALRKRGIDIERVTQVRLIYELTDAGLQCEVAKVGLRDGTEMNMQLRLALSGPIPTQSPTRSPTRRDRNRATRTAGDRS